jgi:Tol biopolymer transport system component
VQPNRFFASVAILAITAVVATAPAASAGTRDRAASTDGVIVWTNRADDGSEHLMIARADGSHGRALTASIPDEFDIDAQISPDGKWIAYEHDTAESAAIHLVRPNGSNDHVVDVGCVDPCVAAASPTWLSDHRLAFSLIAGPFDDTTGNAASAVLWSARIDGTGVRRLSEAGIDGIYEDGYLRVSRDGRYLTFMRRSNADGTSALFRVAPDGSDKRQLTPWGIRAEVNDLSTAERGPTKDLIVFESYGRGDPDATFVDIATVPATCRSLDACTARIHWLTDNAATGRRNANPQWSPDGSSLVFTDRSSIDEPNADIWAMRYGGTERRQISTSPNFDYRPAWGNGHLNRDHEGSDRF